MDVKPQGRGHTNQIHCHERAFVFFNPSIIFFPQIFPKTKLTSCGFIFTKAYHLRTTHCITDFDPSMYGQQQSNRMATFFIYLNDTDAGGATTIPRANGGRMPPNYKAASCEQGIQIHPRKGSGFLLYDMRPDRSLDPYSLHGGCDVKEGTKWGGVVWYETSLRCIFCY